MRPSRVFFVLTLLVLWPQIADAQSDPWRLGDAVDVPDWLRLSGEGRVRYETLDGQFRRNGVGGDQVIASRLLFRAEIEQQRWRFVSELQDSRAFLDDAATPRSGSLINAGELLQAYFEWLLPNGRDAIKIGRFTLDIASRRFVERNDYRNTSNAYSGVHWHRRQTRWELDAFATTPVRRRPGRSEVEALDDNKIALDIADSQRLFWGVHLQRPETLGDVQLDVFVYGLREEDGSRATPDRNVYAPGVRFFKRRATGTWDYEAEGAYRWGRRSESSEPGAPRLDVRASMLHAEFGYTFDNSWSPRLSFEYDWASGDQDPDDGTFGRYERFFGTRRGDLGNTSIHGPLTRANSSIPGFRFLFQKGRLDGRAYVQWAELASRRDPWIVTGQSDPSGASGSSLGETFDFRIRYWLIPGELRLEVGGSAFRHGRFVREAPEAPEANRTLYGYTQLTWTF